MTAFCRRCVSLWIDGELVHLEHLVLHDAGNDIRTPTHEIATASAQFQSGARLRIKVSARKSSSTWPQCWPSE
ncbi:hypothetical protein ATY31_10610 [Sinorhizobium americanum]|uniref:Uncharacterized protein n=1 Tax=Sinorhizobium americanum TaxID=194963 RepID=A0A2S3YQG9_9HYPH|nr:hypothetical protein ATY31_10610 [Sinorhizobium americanum]